MKARSLRTFPRAKRSRAIPGKHARRGTRDSGRHSASRRRRAPSRRPQRTGCAENADGADTNSAFFAWFFGSHRRSKQHSCPAAGQWAAEGEPTIESIPASKTAPWNRLGYRNLAFRTAHRSKVVQRISAQVILGACGLPNPENTLHTAWCQPTSRSGSGFWPREGAGRGGQGVASAAFTFSRSIFFRAGIRGFYSSRSGSMSLMGILRQQSHSFRVADHSPTIPGFAAYR